MTPAARLAAAIEVLDRILAGEAAEKALTGWARASRFAGSKDRAAVRDEVFGGLRCLRSQAALGGSMTGRGVVIGGLRARGAAPEDFFTGEGYAPAPLIEAEIRCGQEPEGNEALDCPNWLAPALRTSLGEDFAPVMQALRTRAPVFLRANLRKASREAVAARLLGEGIVTKPHPLAASALEVQTGERKVHGSAAYGDGWVELQDAASQAVVETLTTPPGAKVLDLCAGGGGKTLAMAAHLDAEFFAWDATPKRMRDLAPRAERAGVSVTVLARPEDAAPYDLVLCDAPCSGSGAWRRSPDAKWRLTDARLAELLATQSEILDAAARLTAPSGVLAYATCSLLDAENSDQVVAFVARNPGWAQVWSRRLTPVDGGDGFFIAHLTNGD